MCKQRNMLKSVSNVKCMYNCILIYNRVIYKLNVYPI